MYSNQRVTFTIDLEVRDTDGDREIANRVRSQLWKLIYNSDQEILDAGKAESN
jgi:hypothetical protein